MSARSFIEELVEKCVPDDERYAEAIRMIEDHFETRTYFEVKTSSIEGMVGMEMNNSELVEILEEIEKLVISPNQEVVDYGVDKWRTKNRLGDAGDGDYERQSFLGLSAHYILTDDIKFFQKLKPDDAEVHNGNKEGSIYYKRPPLSNEEIADDPEEIIATLLPDVTVNYYLQVEYQPKGETNE